MSPKQAQTVSWLFEEALSLSPAELAELLDRECQSDLEVRREVERLLSVNRDMGEDFLEEPATNWLNPSQLRPGDRIKRYEIEDRLGAGGMSVVYRARDTAIGRHVALKLLMPLGDENESGARLFSELRALGALKLDGVVQVFDFGKFQGMPYIVMECLDGEDLSKAIVGGRCGDVTRKLGIARQIAAALRDVHAARIVHRDIKPANVFLEPTGRVKLMDFGMAREDRPPGAQISVLMGTPEFISPEQIKGEQATFRSDIYSYGILLYELFSGTRPFKGQTAALLNQALNEPLPLEALATAGVPEPVVRLIVKATEKEPSSRIESFDRILEALDRLEEPAQPPLNTIPSRTRWMVAATAGLAAATIIGGWVYFRSIDAARTPPIQAVKSVVRGASTPVSTPVASGPSPASEAHTKPEPPKAEAPPPEKAVTASKQAETQPVRPGPTPEDSGSTRDKGLKPSSPPPAPIETPPSIAPRDPGDLAPEVARVLTNPPPIGPAKTPARTDPPPSDPQAEHRKAINELIRNYSHAWRTGNAPAAVALEPGTPLRVIQAVFERASKIEFQLTLLEQPAFVEGSPVVAKFKCHRFFRIEYRDRRTPPVIDENVSVEAALANGEWKIRRMSSIR